MQHNLSVIVSVTLEPWYLLPQLYGVVYQVIAQDELAVYVLFPLGLQNGQEPKNLKKCVSKQLHAKQW